MNRIQTAAEYLWEKNTPMRVIVRREGIELISGEEHHIVSWVQIEEGTFNVLLFQIDRMQKRD